MLRVLTTKISRPFHPTLTKATENSAHKSVLSIGEFIGAIARVRIMNPSRRSLLGQCRLIGVIVVPSAENFVDFHLIFSFELLSLYKSTYNGRSPPDASSALSSATAGWAGGCSPIIHG